MVATQVRVVNEYEEDVAQNGVEIGDIIVKGDGVMNKGTGRFTKDGWLYTGDIGTINKDGQIDIIERYKDISSIEIERLLLNHLAIQEVAVIAMPDKVLGETFHLFIVLHDGYLLVEQDIIDFLRTSLPTPIKYLQAITFLDKLPKTTSGKILKVQLEKLI